MRPSRPVLGLLRDSECLTCLASCSRPRPRPRLLSPPDRPVSRSEELDPAWTRARRILRSAQPPAVAAASLHTLRPFTNHASSARCRTVDWARHPSGPQIARRVPAVCVRPPQDFVNRNSLRSSTSYAVYLVPLIAGALLVYQVTAGASPDTVTVEDACQKPTMAEAGENMGALPGRPGNLTPEQEEKLRKFWEMFLQICGVFDEDGVDGDTYAPAEQGKAAVAGSDKPKKKTLNPFKKRKDKSKESKSADKDAAEPAAVKEHDPEDKWGETKAYHETLAKHPPEEIRATIWAMVKHDNPDALLLRFLRARKWDLQRALVMMVSTMNWRASEMRVESDVIVKGEEHASIDEQSSDEAVKKRAEDFLAQMRIGKSYCYGIDKAGRPICVCRARFHRAGEQSESSLERYTVYLIETTRFLLAPPVDTAVCPSFRFTIYPVG